MFLLGRFAVVAAHETAHGLTMALFGRRVHKAGLKLLMIFPYAYVDTSEMWFEPGGAGSRSARPGRSPTSRSARCSRSPAWRCRPGALRDIFFQLAFAAYVGAFFNLNPFVERDGYQILVDVLREPGLRRRAREQLSRRLSGSRRPDDSPVLARYALFGIAWSVVGGRLRGRHVAALRAAAGAVAPQPVVWSRWSRLGGALRARARGAGRADARAEAQPGGLT